MEDGVDCKPVLDESQALLSFRNGQAEMQKILKDMTKLKNHVDSVYFRMQEMQETQRAIVIQQRHILENMNHTKEWQDWVTRHLITNFAYNKTTAEILSLLEQRTNPHVGNGSVVASAEPVPPQFGTFFCTSMP